jgi:hypothetical protein
MIHIHRLIPAFLVALLRRLGNAFCLGARSAGLTGYIASAGYIWLGIIKFTATTLISQRLACDTRHLLFA